MKKMILILSVFLLGFSTASQAEDYTFYAGGNYKASYVIEFSAHFLQAHIQPLTPSEIPYTIPITYYRWERVSGNISVVDLGRDKARISFLGAGSYMFKYFAVYANGDTSTGYVSGEVLPSGGGTRPPFPPEILPEL